MKKIFLALTLLLLLPHIAHATVSSTTSKVIYTGDGSSSKFSFTFNIYKTTDLVVQKVLTSTGISTTLVLNSDYTVSLTKAAPSAGSITLTAGALASTYQLVILRTLPLTQLINISDPYYTTPAATWNEAHDRATMLAQQLQEQLNRGLLGPTTSSSQITLPTGVAGLCLGWDGTGSALTNLSCSGGSGGGGGSAFNPPIADSQLQTITTSSKVNGSSIYSLSSIPSGAGLVPVANLPVGTSASNIVQLTAATKYPAVDGSLITNLAGANLAGLASTPSGAGVIPIANLATGTPTGSKFIRDDGTLQTPNNTSYATGSYQIFGPTPMVAITGGTYSKFFEMYVPRSGTINVTFLLSEVSDSGHLFGRIYRNGAAVGTERTSDGSTDTFSENISGWTAGDLLQLYCKTSGAGASTSQIAGGLTLKESTPIKEAATSTYIAPTVWSGAGVPPTDLGARGDLYTRTDGGATTTLYVKTAASTWTAK